MNKKTVFAAVGVAAILAAAVLAFTTTSQAAFAATVNIDIVPGASSKTVDAFSLNPAEAHVGDTVAWTNKDTVMHTVTSGTNNTPDGKFGGNANGMGQLLSQNDTQEFKPTKPGDYPYFCSLHPTMVGTLRVEPAGVS
jgi:plastocyanin